jgi:L-alanine-DL-glutamate epimerase-like enolase superfamily enzyme
VDANGGWGVNETIEMMNWLQKREVDYIEQPLAEGREDDLKYVFKNRKLPIYLDESCRYAHQITLWSKYVDGVNLKLMKCGGITEGLKILSTAKLHGLKTMIGCMSESSVAIAASASISGIIDFVDLDSHYNLNPDPSFGTELINGITSVSENPGHGAKLKKIYYAQ